MGMVESTGPRDATDALCVEVIDDRGRVVESVYVHEITGVRALDAATLERVRGGVSRPPAR
jgi:hypothetical protein